MKSLSHVASNGRHLVCPFCESGELALFGPGLARCDPCGLPLLGSVLETLRDVAGLPDALGAHACECGHPEMRGLPDRVSRCPACGAEVLPVTVAEAARPPEGPTGARPAERTPLSHPRGKGAPD